MRRNEKRRSAKIAKLQLITALVNLIIALVNLLIKLLEGR